MRSTSLQPLPLEKWELLGWRIVFCAVLRSFSFFLSRLFFCVPGLCFFHRFFFLTPESLDMKSLTSDGGRVGLWLLNEVFIFYFAFYSCIWLCFTNCKNIPTSITGDVCWFVCCAIKHLLSFENVRFQSVSNEIYRKGYFFLFCCE